MCIRDRYQRRVHGEYYQAWKKIKEKEKCLMEDKLAEAESTIQKLQMRITEMELVLVQSEQEKRKLRDDMQDQAATIENLSVKIKLMETELKRLYETAHNNAPVHQNLFIFISI
eukprot:TRINITY_DN2849_c0_g1_i18.p2 TRINITY_DN2849_c0_g1~~TRINITY_DN2849_c0_g1_i18.p2  ORF type:complete len:114 (-),score=37.31 TRINITY_DN2849_c0_g1_i18:178-519(-)